ncbi:heavy-metal-associated domain-containing protein [Candidatus Daviesbacteria bacterium]|nr:heavy-metal-associated domain-containing protein [Candidatus Daviesbacteria bacterium]MBI2596735.1 heavy-metal-associated domain-containing protein [Candidatus Daviesbacteria bacterium]
MNIKFKVSGMHCNSCVMLIKGELEDLPGVSSIELDFKSGQGSVNIDTDLTTPDKVVTAVSDLGYKIELGEKDNG